MPRLNGLAAALLLPGMMLLGACGLQTPDKDPFAGDQPIGPDFKHSSQGAYESGVVDHITCEMSRALAQADAAYHYKWLREKWGAAVTLNMTAEDQTGMSPGVSFVAPFKNVILPFNTGNVTAAQSYSTSIGGTASVNALRTETIQFTFRNRDAMDRSNCGNMGGGLLIDGDLKLREFVFDKVQIIAGGNGLWDSGDQPFNAWTDEVTFVAAYGGTATPTWKLARLTANTSSNLLIAQRTNTNDLVITLGPIDDAKSKQPPRHPLALTADALSQHNARVSASAIAVSVSGQSH